MILSVKSRVPVVKFNCTQVLLTHTHTHTTSSDNCCISFLFVIGYCVTLGVVDILYSRCLSWCKHESLNTPN